jgi:hypothetical protein
MATLRLLVGFLNEVTLEASLTNLSTLSQPLLTCYLSNGGHFRGCQPSGTSTATSCFV